MSSISPVSRIASSIPKPLPKIPVSSRDILYDSETSSSSKELSKLPYDDILRSRENNSVSEEELIRIPTVNITPMIALKIDASPVNNTTVNMAHSPVFRRRHHHYVVASSMVDESSRFCSAVRGEYHMHVEAASFISIVKDDDVILLLCWPDTISDHCRMMDRLIQTQKGKAICVCIVHKMERKHIVKAKEVMIDSDGRRPYRFCKL